jgi:hypothetical protein
MVKVSDYRGTPIVVYFYPKADTPGRKRSKGSQGSRRQPPGDGQRQGRPSALGRALGARGVAALVTALGALAAGSARSAPVEHHPVATHVAENVPRLTRAQISTARRIVRKDRSVARLFHAVKYHVAHFGPWSTGGDQNRLVGVIFFVDLDHPANVTGIWPTAIYEPQKPFPLYRERNEYFRTVGLHAVTISVDPARRKVAQVRPR